MIRMNLKCEKNKQLFNTRKKSANYVKRLLKKKRLITNSFDEWSVSQIQSEDINNTNFCVNYFSVHKTKPKHSYSPNEKPKLDNTLTNQVNMVNSLTSVVDSEGNETSSRYSSIINSETENTFISKEIESKGLKRKQRNISQETKIKQETTVNPSTSTSPDDFHDSKKSFTDIENVDNFFNSFENCSECDDDVHVNHEDGVQDNTSRSFSIPNLFGRHVSAKKNKKLERINIKRGKGKILNLKGYVILSLQVNTKVHMYGLAKIKVLQGSVEILGYIMNKSSDEVEVYSPKGTSVLYIKSLPTSTAKTKFSEKISLPDELRQSQSFIEEMLDLNGSAVVLCKKFEPPMFTFINKQIAQNIIPKTITSGSCMFREISEEWNVTKQDDTWNDLVDEIIFTSKVFICGGKDVGKSTLMRYVVNTLLKKFNQVCVVDLDPGQPEFTVPGCISTVVVTKPLLGPNYTHIQKPDKCLFISNIDIKLEPNVYLINVKELLDISKDLMQLPTIVNYMGYHRSIGLDLVASVINLVQPTIVVQIQSSNTSKNYEQLLDVTYVMQKLHDLPLYRNNLSYKLITMPSMADDTTTKWVLSARQVRELCVLSYFAKTLPIQASSFFNGEIPIYTINLSDVHLRIESREASLQESNGRLVGLCSLQNSIDTTDLYICHGWGIIRGFDLKTNRLALVTPVPASVLDNVHHLVLGSVDLPPSVYMSQFGIGRVAFVSSGVPQFTSNVPKKKQHFS